MFWTPISRRWGNLGPYDEIDQFHISQSAPVPYPTMSYWEQKWAHLCSEWSIMGYGTGAFWDLWKRSIQANWKTNSLVQAYMYKNTNRCFPTIVCFLQLMMTLVFFYQIRHLLLSRAPTRINNSQTVYELTIQVLLKFISVALMCIP